MLTPYGRTVAHPGTVRRLIGPDASVNVPAAGVGVSARTRRQNSRGALLLQLYRSYCSSLAGARTSTHNELARGLAEYLQECRFTNIRLEVTEWDPGDTNADPTARRARATPSNGFDAHYCSL